MKLWTLSKLHKPPPPNNGGFGDKSLDIEIIFSFLMEALKMMFGKLRPGDKCQTLMILHQYFLNVMSILDLK